MWSYSRALSTAGIARITSPVSLSTIYPQVVTGEVKLHPTVWFVRIMVLVVVVLFVFLDDCLEL